MSDAQALVLAGLRRRELHEGWSLRAAAGPVPDPIATQTVGAEVPGCVHTDLLRADLIPDPYLDDNESALAWIGLVDWTYRTVFIIEADDSDRTDLVFDSLDTVTEIRLNDELIGETANQHRSYRFDVTELLIAGQNTLEVAFRSPVKYANAQSLALGQRERPYPLPYDAIRKSACNFGWDWGIATYTSGIVKPVALESWSVARIAEARVVARVTGEATGTVDVQVDLERTSDVPLTLTLAAAGRTESIQIAEGAASARLSLDLDDVQRWWPVGYGTQPLTDVDLALQTSEGATLDSAHRRVGFRTVRWDTEPDAAGTPFTLIVNDQPVFVKGANWIPDDALPVRVDRARYRRRLEQALAANLNLIRVWGGGLYESDDFYELCDELGLLTWQDFLFACAAYAEEEPLRSEVEAEARQNIVRLASHPSLVLLTGNNENLWGYEDWGWKQRLDGKTWGAYYYYDLFPRLIDELAPHVPYAPGSPFSPDGGASGDLGSETQAKLHPNDEAHGSMHLWEQWNRLDWLTYREHRPRFVAEFGWQGPPAWTTMTRSISDSPLTPESPGMIVHQKAMEGNVKLTGGLVPHFRFPEEMDRWHWAMQLNQALAVRTALEHFRSWAPHTMGAIVWQLNDCWPVTSWAAVDGDERPKPLFHALKAAFAPVLITIQPRDEGLSVVIGNDTAAALAGDLVMRRLAFDGTEIARTVESVDVPARGTATVRLPDQVSAPDDGTRELIVAEIDGVRGFWFFVEPRDSALEPAAVAISIAEADGGVDVTLTTRSLVRDLTLLVDKVSPDAHAVDGLITLLPGESATVRVLGLAAAQAPALSHPAVLRTANELVAS